MNKKTLLTLTILTGIFLMTSSSIADIDQKISATIQAHQQGNAKEDTAKEAEIDLSLKPNESGEVMVLMYHNIGSVEDTWTRTPENFTRDLNTLYEKGYRPISLEDYVTGNIATHEGYTPVVITFDDGHESNFEYLPDGTISMTSAVGLMLAFNEHHPDFPLKATFFLNGDAPFGQKDQICKKLNFLVDNGMDIGNHTLNHPNFNKLTEDTIQMEIGSQKSFLEKFITKSGYVINTFAKPYGTRPLDERLLHYLQAGSYNGVAYNNIAILNVGANPGFSPYDSRFNNLSIPRIRGSELYVDNSGLYNFLQYFDKHPEEKFVSDGFIEMVTVPKEKAHLIKTTIGKELRTY